ncbi:MAG: helix-turn-helix transcriptional regulator [Bacteroidales bacterium]|nr:helix-turn-helix transcriptional regulator [Bacteroidales bacterium]
MQYDSQYLLFFTTSLIYIVVCAYGWLLKTFYVPAAYKDVFGELYPARHSLANLFMMQVFEIPFLFMIGREDVLFFINGASLMFITSYLVVLIKGYFFLDFYTPRRLIILQHPVMTCWIALMLPVIGVIEFTPVYKMIMTVVVLAITLGYLLHLDRCRLRVMNQIREIDEDEFSSDDDFPIKLARSVKWLPLIVCVILIVTFLSDSYYVKMSRDIILIGINVWFAIYSLNPHRHTKKLPQELKKKESTDETATPVKYRLSEKYCKDTEKKLIEIIYEKKLYLEEHLTMNDLTEVMHTNKNYLSEVIARSEFQSFYKLINTLRINHACEMLNEDPSAKLEMVALSSGFSSGSAFSQVFKRLKDISPKEYISQIHAE